MPLTNAAERPVPERLRAVANQVDRLGRWYRGDPERLFAEKESTVVELRRLAREIERGRL